MVLFRNPEADPNWPAVLQIFTDRCLISGGIGEIDYDGACQMGWPSAVRYLLESGAPIQKPGDVIQPMLKKNRFKKFS